MTGPFDIKNIVDLNALTNALTTTFNTKLGLILPIIALEYAQSTLVSTVPSLGGETGRLAQTALRTFFDIWKIEMIIT